MKKRIRNERGAALLETAITIPLILAVCVSIFEFGRAYQTWQVITNAAREGARLSILADSTDPQIEQAVRDYMKNGQLKFHGSATVSINRTVPFGTNTASEISVTYPFDFKFLNPVMKLLNSSSTTGQGTTLMKSTALMRNES